jgi:Ca2+-binding EF-hand superfamily protein
MIGSSINTLKDEGKFNLDAVFHQYGIYDILKQERKVEQIRIDGYLKITLKTLSNYMEREKDSMKMFKAYDSNHDGVLNNEEFLAILNSFKDLELNDYQKIAIIKIADKNKDDNINYTEFLEFLKTILLLKKESGKIKI